MDKQKNWMAKKDFASIREYNCWKAKNWRLKNKQPKIEIQLTDLQKKKKEISRRWYLENREYILYKSRNKKKISGEEEFPGQYKWVKVSLEDRDFVHNFNPDDFPGYKENLEIYRLKLKNNILNT